MSVVWEPPLRMTPCTENILNQSCRRCNPRTTPKRTFSDTNSFSPPSKRKSLELATPPPVKSYQDLLDLCCLCKTQSFRDCDGFENLLAPLSDLAHMVGIEHIKEAIFNWVIAFGQKTNASDRSGLCDHIVITGPPGVGKTTLANKLAALLAAMGRIQSNTVVHGTAENMIGEYIGHTYPKTQKVIERAFGGVLLLDEAYTLGTSSSKHGFAVNCLDCLNRNLTENGDKFVCIIAGYQKELNERIFQLNPGLRRRFSYYFRLKPFSPTQLTKVCLQKLSDLHYNVDGKVQNYIQSLCENNTSSFPFSGGSIDTFVQKIQASHTRRVFGHTDKLTLEVEDVSRGWTAYKAHVLSSNLNALPTRAPLSMYI